MTGRVQGVGMRPYVYRLAAEFSLTGFVFNDTRGVTIEVQGTPEKLSQFAGKAAITCSQTAASADSQLQNHRYT